MKTYPIPISLHLHLLSQGSTINPDTNASHASSAFARASYMLIKIKRKKETRQKIQTRISRPGHAAVPAPHRALGNRLCPSSHQPSYPISLANLYYSTLATLDSSKSLDPRKIRNKQRKLGIRSTRGTSHRALHPGSRIGSPAPRSISLALARSLLIISPRRVQQLSAVLHPLQLQLHSCVCTAHPEYSRRARASTLAVREVREVNRACGVPQCFWRNNPVGPPPPHPCNTVYYPGGLGCRTMNGMLKLSGVLGKGLPTTTLVRTRARARAHEECPEPTLVSAPPVM